MSHPSAVDSAPCTTPGSGGAIPPPGRRPRRTIPGFLLLTITVVTALAVLGVVVVRTVTKGPRPTVVATIPYWNVRSSLGSVAAHPGVFDQVSPWLYTLDEQGGIQVLEPGFGAEGQIPVRALQRHGMRVIPTISNTVAGQPDRSIVQAMIRDPARTAAHVQNVVSLVTSHGYDGIDINYQDLTANDRDSFSVFVRQLAEALHAKGKAMSATLLGKDSVDGYDERNQAQDYGVIGQAVDQVRLMAYNVHWSTSEPGPIAPLRWVGDVVDYATSQIPRKKIVLDNALFGYDWTQDASGSRGKVVSWGEVYGLSRRSNSPVQWDASSRAPWFQYTDSAGKEHTVWFENAYSLSGRLEVLTHSSVHGVSVLLTGGEDDYIWPVLSRTLGVGKSSR